LAARASSPEDVGSLRFTSARLEFRPIEIADMHAIAALHAEDRVTRQLVDGIPDTPGKALVFVLWNQPMRRKGSGTFAVRRRGELQLIGLFSLTPFKDDDRLLELGGKLHPSAWRGSLAVEAGAAMIEHAFTGLGRDRLISAFHPENRPVPGALARLGFTPAASTELFGKQVSTMTLACENWRAQGSAPRRRSGRPTNLCDYGRTPVAGPYAIRNGA